MVFWITFQQMNFFDYFRPGDVKNLEKISSFHMHKEIIILKNKNSGNVFQELKLKMVNPKFRFMKIICEEKKLIKDKTYFKEKTSEKNFKSCEENKSYYIKLYKLSDIFQYLSVIEIHIDNYEGINEEKKKKIERNNSAETEKEKNIQIGLTNRQNKKTKIIKNVNESGNGEILQSNIKIKSVSVSIFPSFIPFGFIFGYLFFFVPFTDFGCNEKYVQELKNYFDLIQNNKKNDDNDSNCKNEKSEEAKKNYDVINNENSVSTENESFSDVQEYVLPPSKIFFIFFILFPILSAAYFLLSFQ